jgi:hypothetical protein
MRRNKKNVIGLMLSLTRVLLVPSNETQDQRQLARARVFLS